MSREDVADAGAVAPPECAAAPRGSCLARDAGRRARGRTRCARRGGARERGARSPRPTATGCPAPRPSASSKGPTRSTSSRRRKIVCEMARFHRCRARPGLLLVGQRPDGTPSGSAACPLMPSRSGRSANARATPRAARRGRRSRRPGRRRRLPRARRSATLRACERPGAEPSRDRVELRVSREDVCDAIVLVLIDDEQPGRDIRLVLERARCSAVQLGGRARAWRRRGRTWARPVRPRARGYRPSPSAPGSTVTSPPLVSVVLATHDAVRPSGRRWRAFCGRRSRARARRRRRRVRRTARTSSSQRSTTRGSSLLADEERARAGGLAQPRHRRRACALRRAPRRGRRGASRATRPPARARSVARASACSARGCSRSMTHGPPRRAARDAVRRRGCRWRALFSSPFFHPDDPDRP